MENKDIKTKTEINKTCVRHTVRKYIEEDKKKTKQLLGINKMKVCEQYLGKQSRIK